MTDVILQMAGLILCGWLWRVLKPAGLNAAQTRTVLTSLVYYLLLPALVLSVLWRAELDESALIIASAAALGILSGMLLSLLASRLTGITSARTGAILLATAFPNATYMGLPVLDEVFGSWASSVAIQYDLFACTPLLFTLGVLISARLGRPGAASQVPLSDLSRIPALWAALLAVALNLLAVPVPVVVDGWLDLLQRGVVPLMLIALGLSLQWQRTGRQDIALYGLVIVLRLFVLPGLVLMYVGNFQLSAQLQAAIVLEAAMPSMVIGIVLCERFGLDTGLYAALVTITTVLSLFTLPLWYGWLML